VIYLLIISLCVLSGFTGWVIESYHWFKKYLIARDEISWANLVLLKLDVRKEFMELLHEHLDKHRPLGTHISFTEFLYVITIGLWQINKIYGN